jgi:hypothetical protein
MPLLPLPEESMLQYVDTGSCIRLELKYPPNGLEWGLQW